MEKDDEIIEILRERIKEQRALLNGAAAIIIKNQDREENKNWLEAAEKYGVVSERSNNQTDRKLDGRG